MAISRFIRFSTFDTIYYIKNHLSNEKITMFLFLAICLTLDVSCSAKDEKEPEITVPEFLPLQIKKSLIIGR